VGVAVEVRINRFPRMAARFAPAVRDITQLAVFKVVELADPNTPVGETGFLKNNKEIGPDFVHWIMHYAGYVNFGTVHMAPRPFATDAAEAVRPQWMQALGQIERRL
jgi:hypothetical protein